MKFVITGILYFVSFLVALSQFEMVPGKINPFKSGESLKYSIRYGPIHGG